jgi:phosphatidylserine/phosphatidylglycerophosphate/cardiolipin synthase-like enzyme
MPREPNVYPHANAATLRALLHHPGPGAFSALLHPSMVHAKAAVGFRHDGSAVAVIGSANLKCRSLTQFGELLMRCDGGEFAQSLAAALTRLAAESDAVRHEPIQAADPVVEWVSRGLAKLLRPGTAELLDDGGAPALRYVPVVAALEEWMG